MRPRLAAGAATVLTGLVLAACGGSSPAPKVGACIDASNKVVDCSSSSAKQKLVSDQETPDATACIVIGDKPQATVTVAGHRFCAEPK